MGRPRTVLEGVDFNELTAHIDRLKDDVERYKALYEAAVKGRADFRDAFRDALRAVQEGEHAADPERLRACIREVGELIHARSVQQPKRRFGDLVSCENVAREILQLLGEKY